MTKDIFKELDFKYDNSLNTFGEPNNRYVLQNCSTTELVDWANKNKLGLYRDKDCMFLYDADSYNAMKKYNSKSRFDEFIIHNGEKGVYLGETGERLWKQGMNACRKFDNSYYWSRGGVHALERKNGETIYEASGRFEIINKRKQINQGDEPDNA